MNDPYESNDLPRARQAYEAGPAAAVQAELAEARAERDAYADLGTRQAVDPDHTMALQLRYEAAERAVAESRAPA